jgi:hypothetical protein
MGVFIDLEQLFLLHLFDRFSEFGFAVASNLSLHSIAVAFKLATSKEVKLAAGTFLDVEHLVVAPSAIAIAA